MKKTLLTLTSAIATVCFCCFLMGCSDGPEKTEIDTEKKETLPAMDEDKPTPVQSYGIAD